MPRPTPQDFPGSAQTQNDRTTWDAMDAVSDKIALIFAGNEPFDILAGANPVIPVPAGTQAQRLAALAAFKGRRDDLGTTHHDAGTMRMGDNIADAVTNDFGRIHDTTNCYVAGPALFPTVGSPNPDAHRRGARATHRRPAQCERAAGARAGRQPAAGGRLPAALRRHGRDLQELAARRARRRRHAPSQRRDGQLRRRRAPAFLLRTETFGDFTLRLQFRIFDVANHNSGVFVRFPRPTLDLCAAALNSALGNEPFFDPGNPAWKPVIAGFEVQIDDNALGDSSKDFYGIRPEPNGLFKNRTGAIYKIQAGDRIWHLNINEPAVQNYTPGPALVPGVWFEYEIVVQGDDYTVFLTNMQTGERRRRQSFHNTDAERGRSPGFIGIQAYPGNTVAWRHIRIKT